MSNTITIKKAASAAFFIFYMIYDSIFTSAFFALSIIGVMVDP